MNKLLVLLLILLVPSVCSALSLAWDKNNTEPDLAGYNVYEVSMGPRQVKLNATVIPVTVCTGTPIVCKYSIDMYAGQFGRQFVVTAVDTAGNESADSNVATYIPFAPTGIQIR